jgi:hypothetical protein
VRLALSIIGFTALVACGDRGWYTPTTEVEVTRIGCAISQGTGRHEVMVNVFSERMPNGQIRCVIETLVVPEKK